MPKEGYVTITVPESTALMIEELVEESNPRKKTRSRVVSVAVKQLYNRSKKTQQSMSSDNGSSKSKKSKRLAF